MPLLFTLFSLIAFCNILFVKSQTFHVTDQAITANLLLRSGIAPSENDDLVNLKYIEEQFALYRTSVLKESQRDSFHQSVRSASCPVPEFLSVVSTGSRTYVPLTGYTEVPQVYVTAYTPTPVFSVPVNITANGFFIMTVLKNMEETDIASHYDIMVVPEKSNANFCPSMRNWSKTLTGANTYSITALPVAPTCLISPVFDDFITESIRVRFKEYSTTTAFTPWRYPNHGEVTVVCFTENYLPEKTQTGTADLSTVGHITYSVTFDESFDAPPLIFAMSIATGNGWQISIESSSSTGFVASSQNTAGYVMPDIGMKWVAIPAHYASINA